MRIFIEKRYLKAARFNLTAMVVTKPKIKEFHIKQCIGKVSNSKGLRSERIKKH